MPDPITPTPETDGGSADLTTSLMAELTATPAAPASPAPTEPAAPAEPPKSPQDAPAKPEAAKTAPAPAKPATPPPATAKAAPAPAKELDIDDPKVPAAELRRHLKEIKAKTQQTVAEKEAAIAQANAKLKQLEGKRYWSEDDEKNHATVTAKLVELEAEKYGRDYRESPEYKKLYQDKINEQAQEAAEAFASLSVKVMGEDGEEKTRPGTGQDMMRLFHAPNLVERRKLAKEMFGADFQEAIDLVNPMLATQKAANQAVKDKTENYQSETQQRAEQARTMQGQVQQFVQQHSKQLAESMPDIFKAPDDKPEIKAALERGFAFVDQAVNSQDPDPHSRAAKIAVIRSLAGVAPRLILDVKRLMAENAALAEENAKYRGSDPGNLGEAGGQAAPKEDDRGSDSLVDEIKELQKQANG